MEALRCARISLSSCLPLTTRQSFSHGTHSGGWKMLVKLLYAGEVQSIHILTWNYSLLRIHVNDITWWPHVWNVVRYPAFWIIFCHLSSLQRQDNWYCYDHFSHYKRNVWKTDVQWTKTCLYADHLLLCVFWLLSPSRALWPTRGHLQAVPKHTDGLLYVSLPEAGLWPQDCAWPMCQGINAPGTTLTTSWGMGVGKEVPQVLCFPLEQFWGMLHIVSQRVQNEINPLAHESNHSSTHPFLAYLPFLSHLTSPLCFQESPPN